MEKLISRPARGALPLALAICAALIPGGAERGAAFMAALMLSRGLSLGAGSALRATAGEVVRASRLRGNMLTAIIMAILGGGLSVLLCALDIPYLRDIGVWVAVGGAAVNMAQMLADRLYTSRDSGSAAIFDVITALLTAVGVIIADNDPWLLALLTGSGATAGALLLIGLRSGSSIQKGFKVLRSTPGALAKGWVFPALLSIAALAYAQLETDVAALIAGIAVIEWCEPPYRRDDDESGVCGLCLCGVALAWTMLCGAGGYIETQLPEWNSRAHIISPLFMCAVPAGCCFAALTGLNVSFRRAAMVLLMLTACFGGAWLAYSGIAQVWEAAIAAVGVYAVCILLFAPDIHNIRLRARARRLQKRRR